MVYLLKMVIFYGYVSHDQRVIGNSVLKASKTFELGPYHELPIQWPWNSPPRSGKKVGLGHGITNFITDALHARQPEGMGWSLMCKI